MNWRFRKTQEQRGSLEKAFAAFNFEQKFSSHVRNGVTHPTHEKLLFHAPYRKMGIQQLPTEVIAKLRSGIAITDVIHCVEELVSNSIDAGATCIAVRINLPYFNVQVIDNGEGISLDQMDLIGERYATSKCSSLKDLQNIKSGGFRGEALASLKDISSILIVESRHKSSRDTYSKLFTHGKAKNTQSVAERASKGTTVTVQDFLYNMPVRRKCISEALDLEECRKSLEKMALIHPHISFSLRDDSTGEICMETKKCKSIYNSFTYIYGREKAQHMKEICFAEGKYEISGYASLVGHISKDLQLLYVNKRFICRCKLHKLINKMFAKVLFTRQKRNLKDEPRVTVSNIDSPQKSQVQYGIFVLNITCPYDECDITFHPRKTVVAFSDEEKIIQLVEKAVLNFFKSNNLLSESNSDTVHCTDSPTTSFAHNKSEFPLNVGNDINVINMSKALLSLPVKRVPDGSKKRACCSSPKKMCFEGNSPDFSKETAGENIDCLCETIPNKNVTKCDKEHNAASLGHISKNTSTATDNENSGLKKGTTKMSCWEKGTNEQRHSRSNCEEEAPNRTVFPNSNPVMLLANINYPCNDLPMSSEVETTFDFLKKFQCPTLRHKVSFKDSDTSLQNKEISKCNNNAVASRQVCTSEILGKKQISRFSFGDTTQLKQLKNMRIKKKSNNASAVSSEHFISCTGVESIENHTREVSHSKFEDKSQFLIKGKQIDDAELNLVDKQEIRRHEGKVLLKKAVIEKHVPDAYISENLKKNIGSALGVETVSFLEGHQKRGHAGLFSVSKSLISNETKDFAAESKSKYHSNLQNFENTLKLNENCMDLRRYANVNVNNKECQTENNSQIEFPKKNLSNLHCKKSSLVSNSNVKDKLFPSLGCFTDGPKFSNRTETLDIIVSESPVIIPETTSSVSVFRDVRQQHLHQHISNYLDNSDSTHSKHMFDNSKRDICPSNLHQLDIKHVKSDICFEKHSAANDKHKKVNNICNASELSLHAQHENQPLPISFELPRRQIITSCSDLPPVFKNMLENKCDAPNERHHVASGNYENHGHSSPDPRKDQIVRDFAVNEVLKSKLNNSNTSDISMLVENANEIPSSPQETHQVSNNSASDFICIAKSSNDGINTGATESTSNCKSELNSDFDFNHKPKSCLDIIEDSVLMHEENERIRKVQETDVSDRNLEVKTLTKTSLGNANDNFQLNSMANIPEHHIPRDGKALSTSAQMNCNFLHETQKDEKLSIGCEAMHISDCKVESIQGTCSKGINPSSMHQELSSDGSGNNFMDNSHSTKITVSFVPENCSNSESLTEEKTSKMNCINDSYVEKNEEKPAEIISERWHSKTDPLTQRTIFIDKISGNSTFVLPTVCADDLYNENGDPTKTKLHTSHFFLTHNASPFTMRPISLRKQAMNDKVVNETAVESGLKGHIETQENLSVSSKWSVPVPDMTENAVEQLFSSWENPMFKNVPSEIDLTYNPGSSKSQKIMYNILNMHRFSKKAFSSLKVIGQVDNKFIACIVRDINENYTGKKLLVLFDQHAVHERIRLEKIMEDLYETDASGGRRVKSSVISPPLNIKVEPNEARLLKTYHTHLLHFGINLVPQDAQDIFEIHSVPACLVERINSELKRKRDANISSVVETLVREWITQLEQTRSVSTMLPKTLVGVLNSQACHGAVKFGDPLDKAQCISLLESLSQCNLPFQCAHGRPSLAPILDIQKILFSKQASKPRLWKLSANRTEIAR